ncbi:MAG: hypothetical protein RLZZ67_327 [Candidatus Parcubacteria bacterium]|jgi:very-short-patch-repair endonuclease
MHNEPLPKPVATPQVTALDKALKEIGVKTVLEHWDGHKHIDIAILDAKMFIEVDGLYHFVNAEQIEKDFKRNHFSDGDDFVTMRITNQLIDSIYLERIAEAIKTVVDKRLRK